MKYLIGQFTGPWIPVLVFLLAGFNGIAFTQSGTEWKKGDWWLIRQKQQAIWMNVQNPPWINAGTLKFTIKNVNETPNGKTFMVEVTDSRRPALLGNKWQLNLVYSNNFQLVNGTYRVGNTAMTIKKALKYFPLKRGGLDMSSLDSEKINREPMRDSPNTMRFMDKRIKKERLFHRIDMPVPNIYKRLEKAETREYQLWLPTEPCWRYYERSFDLPVRAEMIDCSKWKKQ